MVKIAQLMISLGSLIGVENIAIFAILDTADLNLKW